MTARLLPLLLALALAAPAHAGVVFGEYAKAGAAAEKSDAAAGAAAKEAAEPGSASQALYLEAMQLISEGRKKDASEVLKRVFELEPQHAAAYMDLALIQCELGHAEYANSLFHTIETRFALSQGMHDLINSARAKGCSEWVPNTQWSLTAGRGYDDNVNQGASSPLFVLGLGGLETTVELPEENLPHSDGFTVLSGDYQRDLNQNGLTGYAQLQLRRNDQLHKYDTAALLLGIDQPWRFGNWQSRGSATFTMLGLGGSLYYRHTALQARVTPPLPLPARMQLHLVGGVSHLRFDGLSAFNATLADLRAQLVYRNERMQLLSTLGYGVDNALGARPGGDRHGWTASVVARRQLPLNLVGELGYTRQSWLSEAEYSPGIIPRARDQVSHSLRGMLTLPIDVNQAVSIEARMVRNRENISIFQYNSRMLQINWQLRK